jgi:hypothetical protein
MSSQKKTRKRKSEFLLSEGTGAWLQVSAWTLSHKIHHFSGKQNKRSLRRIRNLQIQRPSRGMHGTVN